MRPLRALVLYIAVVFVGGAVLAPWFYGLAQALTHIFPNLVFFATLAQTPFHRFVNRSLLVLALAGLWPLLRGLGAASWRETGLVNPCGQWRKLAGGFLLGFLSLALVAAITLAAGGRALNHPLAALRVAERMLSAALTAAVVAGLEEILFRGGIFGGLRRVFHWPFALGLSSMIYALVHFFARTQDPATVYWTSGFGQLALMLGGFMDWQQIVPGFFNLTLAGILLGLAYQRTGNLYFSIGLHAGWIFWLKIYGTLTTSAARSKPMALGHGKNDRRLARARRAGPRPGHFHAVAPGAKGIPAGMTALAANFQEWLNAGLAFLYPEVCQLCGAERGPRRRRACLRRLPGQGAVHPAAFCERCGRPFEGDITTPFECANCRGMEWHFQSARSAVVARGPVLEVIHRYKYQRALWFEPFLADLLIRAAAPVLRKPEAGPDRAGAAASARSSGNGNSTRPSAWPIGWARRRRFR